MKWTSSTQCTCPQGTTAGSEARRFISPAESQASLQWKDFCELTPIDKAGDSVTLLQLLSRIRKFTRGTVQISPET